jgi:hypothetical protein
MALLAESLRVSTHEFQLHCPSAASSCWYMLPCPVGALLVIPDGVCLRVIYASGRVLRWRSTHAQCRAAGAFEAFASAQGDAGVSRARARGRAAAHA